MQAKVKRGRQARKGDRGGRRKQKKERNPGSRAKGCVGDSPGASRGKAARTKSSRVGGNNKAKKARTKNAPVGQKGDPAEASRAAMKGRPKAQRR